MPSTRMNDTGTQLRVEQYIQSRDGTCQLYHHMWKERVQLRAVVFIVHGLGEHCHRYDRIIEFFTEQGIRVYSFDQRGHGRTHLLPQKHSKQGKQGHIHHDKEVIMDDIEQLLQRASQDGVPARIPRILLGHSLGGLFSIYYALTRDLTGISGLISLAPAIKVVNPPNPLLRAAVPLGAFLFPHVTIEGNIELKEISRLPEVLDSIRADPMIHRKISFGTGNVVLQIGYELDRIKQPEISIPSLFIHGTSDSITDCKATEEFYNRLICPKKSLFLNQGGYHKPHDDIGTEQVFEEIQMWLEVGAFVPGRLPYLLCTLLQMQDPNNRYDNSLGLLTRKFVNLLKESPEGILDLNFAAKELEVQKRRIYDITNVLEGIGLIEKNSKNNVRWKGSASSDPESVEVKRLQRLREEVMMLKREEANLDKSYEMAQGVLRSMSEEEYNKRLCYLTHTDIRNIPSFADETLLAVKAPYGSTLEVPDPDEGMPPGQRRYEVQLSSKSGPIDVFLIQDPNATSAASSAHHATESSLHDPSHFHAAEMLKPFDIPVDAFAFEMKADEGAADLYGLGASGADMYNVFVDRRL